MLPDLARSRWTLSLGHGVSAVTTMRVAWLAPLFLAYVCLSLESPDDQSSCGALPTEPSGCSLAPSHLRVTRAVKDPFVLSSRSSRSIKLKKRHIKSKKLSRVARSTQEDFADTEVDDSPEPSSNPRHQFTNYEEQQAPHVQGDWNNAMRHVHSSAFLPPRYCPHCRQPLPPDSPFLPHPIDPRIFLPPRFNGPSIPLGPREEFSNSNMNKPYSPNPEEFSPFNYRVAVDESEKYSPDYLNQTTSTKELKKTPVALSDVFLESPSPDDSPLFALPKTEKASMLKKTKLQSPGDLTKYLEMKNSS